MKDNIQPNKQFLKQITELQKIIKKDTKGFGYKYSTLEDLISEMHKLNIHVVFNSFEKKEDYCRIEGYITYDEEIQTKGYIEISSGSTKIKDVHGHMGLLTYGRRYLSYMLLGIQPSNMDDDGEILVERPKEKKTLTYNTKTYNKTSSQPSIKDIYNIQYEEIDKSPLIRG